MTQITIWNEFRHERTDPHVAVHYPHGVHAALAQGLTRTGWAIRTATLDEAEQGLPGASSSTRLPLQPRSPSMVEQW
jgi:trehalose utilization protein